MVALENFGLQWHEFVFLEKNKMKKYGNQCKLNCKDGRHMVEDSFVKIIGMSLFKTCFVT